MGQGKLDCYNLGEQGVVIDNSPIHTMDGQLAQAQNAQVDNVGVAGGIRKRDGITKLNSSAMAGTVTGMTGLSLVDETVPATATAAYAPLENVTANTFFRLLYVAGLVTAPARAIGAVTGGAEDFEAPSPGGNGTLIWASHRNAMYYPGNDYTPGTTAPTIHKWDGALDTVLAYIPNSQFSPSTPARGITSIISYSATQLLVCVIDTLTGSHFRLLMYDTSTGAFTQVGPDLGKRIYNGIVVWQGRIWVSGRNAAAGSAPTVYWIRPGDTSWTQDLDTSSANPLAAFTGNGYCMGLVEFKGELYLAAGADAGTTPKIFKRTQAAVWSTVYTGGGGTNALDYVGPLIVGAAGAKLFAYEMIGNTATNKIIESTTGSSWSTSYDISGTIGSIPRSGQPALIRETDVLLWPLASGSAFAAGAVLQRSAAGAWSTAVSVVSAAGAIRGPVMQVNF